MEQETEILTRVATTAVVSLLSAWLGFLVNTYEEDPGIEDNGFLDLFKHLYFVMPLPEIIIIMSIMSGYPIEGIITTALLEIGGLVGNMSHKRK